MEKQKLAKCMITWLALFAVSIGMFVACNGKKTGRMKPVPGSASLQNAKKDSATKTFTADLGGSHEASSVNSDASGSLTVRLRGDSVHVKGQFSGLSSAYISSQIEQGSVGKDGKIIQSLKPSNNANNKAGSWGGSYNWSASSIKALKAGSLYVNITSKKFAKGEIGGRLKSSQKGAEDYQKRK